jgi:hypothetical protein
VAPDQERLISRSAGERREWDIARGDLREQRTVGHGITHGITVRKSPNSDPNNSEGTTAATSAFTCVKPLLY